MKLILLTALLLVLNARVFADYVVTVQLDMFSNPDHQLANGRCCEVTSQLPSCPSTCVERMKICLRDAGHPMNDTENCPLLSSSNLNVNPRGLTLRRITGPWPQDTGIQSLFIITDASSGNIIDEIFADIQMVANAPLSESATHVGGHGRIEVVFRFQVQCSIDFYGPDCNTHCVGRDDESAHLGCDEETGLHVCLPGYRNLSSNCTDCALAEGCSEQGGFCEAPGECHCFDGYSGDNCNIAPTTIMDFVSSTTFAIPSPSPTPSVALISSAEPTPSSPSQTPAASPSSSETPSESVPPSPSPTPPPTPQTPTASSSSSESPSDPSTSPPTPRTPDPSTSSPSDFPPPVLPTEESTEAAAVTTPPESTPSAPTSGSLGFSSSSPRAGVIAGAVLGSIAVLLLFIVAALLVGFIVLVLWKRHQHIHSPTRGGHWYMTDDTIPRNDAKEEESNTIAVRYTSSNAVSHYVANGGEHAGIPGFRADGSNGVEMEMKSVHQVKRNWYSEPDRIYSTNALDNNSIFSDTSFETMSKHSHIDVVSVDNNAKVIYSEVIKNKREEDSDDDELLVLGEKDVEENEEKGKTNGIMYAEVSFSED